MHSLSIHGSSAGCCVEYVPDLLLVPLGICWHGGVPRHSSAWAFYSSSFLSEEFFPLKEHIPVLWRHGILLSCSLCCEVVSVKLYSVGFDSLTFLLFLFLFMLSWLSLSHSLTFKPYPRERLLRQNPSSINSGLVHVCMHAYIHIYIQAET